MGLFDGLGKFGVKENIGQEIEEDLFLSAKEKRQKRLGALKENTAEEEIPLAQRLLEIEKSSLFKKSVVCTCCDKKFPVLAPRSGRIRRLEPDVDLRPRSEHFDVLKYGVYHCPYCGYTSVARTFPRLSDRARKEIESRICQQFKPEPPADDKEFLTYDEAIDYHKLALLIEVIKDGKASDKAYLCLLIGWLYRGKREALERDGQEENAEELAACMAGETECLEQAFEGFQKALSTETAPFAGMDELTTEYLFAALAYKTCRYPAAARSISNIILSRSASSRIKDKARMLKEEIIQKIRVEKKEE